MIKIYASDSRFNAVGDGVTDDTAAIQGAIDEVQDNGGGIVFLDAGRYRITDSLHINADMGKVILRGAGPSTGNGTQIWWKPDPQNQDDSKSAICITTKESCASQFVLEDICLIDKLFEEQSVPGNTGIRIGKSGEKMDGGYGASRCINLVIEHFQTGIEIFNVREIDFERISMCSEQKGFQGIVVKSDEPNFFTGDLTFRNVKSTCWAENSNCLSLESIASNSEVRGLHFTDCIFYSGEKSISIFAKDGGSVQDIWFTSCACDGPTKVQGEDAYWIEAQGNGKVRGVQISNPYIVNYTGHGINFTSTGSEKGKVAKCSVNGGYIGMIGLQGINIYSSEYINISNVNFFDVYKKSNKGGTGVIQVSGKSKYVVISGCTESKDSSKAACMIRIQDQASYVTAIGNMGHAIKKDDKWEMIEVGSGCTEIVHEGNNPIT